MCDLKVLRIESWDRQRAFDFIGECRGIQSHNLVTRPTIKSMRTLEIYVGKYSRRPSRTFSAPGSRLSLRHFFEDQNMSPMGVCASGGGVRAILNATDALLDKSRFDRHLISITDCRVNGRKSCLYLPRSVSGDLCDRRSVKTSTYGILRILHSLAWRVGIRVNDSGLLPAMA